MTCLRSDSVTFHPEFECGTLARADEQIMERVSTIGFELDTVATVGIRE